MLPFYRCANPDCSLSRFSNSYHIGVLLLGLPFLRINETSKEGHKGTTLSLHIECKSNATSKWIFSGQIIDQNKKYQDYEITSYYNDQSTNRLETMLIRDLNRNHQGIYTVEVKDEHCINTNTIYVTVVK